MSVLADFRFAALSGVSLDGATTATLNGVTAGSGVKLPSLSSGWGLGGPRIADAVALTDASRIAVPLAGVSGIELLLKPAPMQAVANVLTGTGTAITVRLVPLPDGRVYPRAIAHLESGDVTIEAPDRPLGLGSWVSLAAVVTGDDINLAVGGVVVVRRVLSSASLRATTGGVTIGALADGSVDGFEAHVGVVRLCDTVPPMTEEPVGDARVAGIGEIEGRWLALGGDAGFVGGPILDEQAAAGGRYRVFSGATIAWHRETGVHVLRTPIREHWLQLGGPVGVLGYPSSEEVDAAAYFRAHPASVFEGMTVSPLPGGTIGKIAAAAAAAAAAGASGSAPSPDPVAVPIGGLVPSPGAGAHLGGASDGAGSPGPGTDPGPDLDGIPIAGAKPGGMTWPFAKLIALERARMSRFQGGAIVRAAGGSPFEVHGEAFLRWLVAGAVLGDLGLPVADSEYAGGEARRNRFEGGTIFSSPWSGVHLVSGPILDAATDATGWPRHGWPVSDVEPVRRPDGGSAGGWLCRFTDATYYHRNGHTPHFLLPDFEAVYAAHGGPVGELGWPTMDAVRVGASKVWYQDFEHGMVVWDASGARILRSLSIRLGSAETYSIDDGYDGLSEDQTAELFVKVTITRDGEPLDGWDHRRIPGGNAHSPKKIDFGGLEIEIDAPSSDTVIGLSFEGWDADEHSRSDSLGSVSVDYGIETLWGQLGAQGAVHEIQSTAKDGSVTYRFTIGEASTGVPPIHQMRELGWWNFDNFSTATLTWPTYTSTYVDVEARDGAWDTLTHPLDELFYALVYKDAADTGNCHGMADLARRSLNGMTMFTPPLRKYYNGPSMVEESDVPPTLRREINIRMGAQFGSVCLSWVLDRLLDGSAFYPALTYDRLRALIQGGDRPLVGMFNIADFRGHTVMAYHYRDAYGAYPDTIFVCDPNTPYDSTHTDYQRSRIEFDNGGFRLIVDGTPSDRYVGHPPDLLVAGTLGMAMSVNAVVLDFPSHVMDQPLRTPVWDIVNALTGGLGGMLAFSGDVSATQLRSGGQSFYGTRYFPAGTGQTFAKYLGGSMAQTIMDGRLRGFTALHAAIGAASASDVRPLLSLDVEPELRPRMIEPEGLFELVKAIGAAKLAKALNPVINVGAIPGLMRMPMFDRATTGELFLVRDSFPQDLSVEWQADRTGVMQSYLRTGRTAIHLRGDASIDDRGTVQFDRVRRDLPVVRMTSQGSATPMEIEYGIHRSAGDRPPRRLRASLNVGSAGETLFGPGDGLDIELHTAVAAPASVIEIEHVAGDAVQTIVVPVPVLAAGDRLLVRPSDLGSPLGAHLVEHTHGNGKTTRKTVNPKDKHP